MEDYQEHNHHVKWLTEKQVHELTTLSLSTLRSHRFYGKGIPYSKIGRSVRYLLADVVDFMEARRICPRSEKRIKARSSESATL